MSGDFIHGPAPVCPDCGREIGEDEPTVRRVRPWGIAHEQCPVTDTWPRRGTGRKELHRTYHVGRRHLSATEPTRP